MGRELKRRKGEKEKKGEERKKQSERERSQLNLLTSRRITSSSERWREKRKFKIN